MKRNGSNPDEAVAEFMIEFTSHGLRLLFLEITRTRGLQASTPRKSGRGVLVKAPLDDIAAAFAEALRLHSLICSQCIRAVIDVFETHGLQVPSEYEEHRPRARDIERTGRKENT